MITALLIATAVVLTSLSLCLIIGAVISGRDEQQPEPGKDQP